MPSRQSDHVRNNLESFWKFFQWIDMPNLHKIFIFLLQSKRQKRQNVGHVENMPKHPSIGTSYPKIATDFKSLYVAEISALLPWNLSWWFLLPCLRFSQSFIIFFLVVLDFRDSSFLELGRIRGSFNRLFRITWANYINISPNIIQGRL